MSDYIKAIANKINDEKKPVILYGAGSDAIFIIMRLKNQYAVSPTCVCDSNIDKHHHKIQGVEILPLEEALSYNLNAFIYISSRTYKHEIIGNLLASGKVTKEQILNYETVEFRKSCRYLENDIAVGSNHLNFCCSDFGKNKSPYVDFKGDYELVAREFVSLREKLIHDLSAGLPTTCDGCPCIRASYYAVDRKIRIYNYSADGICNFKCSYCTAASKYALGINESGIDCEKMLNVLDHFGLTSADYTVDLAPGEITVHPKRNEIYGISEMHSDIILTNASIYDERIARILKERGRLYISIDAGTRATYKVIKGVDLFDKVRENLKRYKEAVGFAPYELKYIFMPSINDNNDNVDGFAEFCKEVDAANALISYDFNAPQPNDKTILAVKRLISKLKANYISYSIISDIINRAIC